MDYSYTKKLDTTYTSVDRSGRLGLVESMDINQDMITEFFASVGSDNLVLRRKSNAAWVYTRTKMKVEQLPFWKTRTIARSYVSSRSPVRLDVETVLADEGQNVLFRAKTQMCAIDFVRRSLCRIADLPFPADLDPSPSALEVPYSRFGTEFTEDDFALEERVYASDTDFTRHTNNTRYVKYLMDSFGTGFYDGKTVTGLEVQFVKESSAGDVLRVYKKRSGEHGYGFLIKNRDEPVVRAELSYSDRAAVLPECF